jgi:hypothetical protein
MTAGVDFNTLVRPDAMHYVPKDAYNQSKAANILCAIELSKHFKGQINGYSLHAGGMYIVIVFPVLVMSIDFRLAIFTNIMQKEDAVATMQNELSFLRHKWL